MRFKQWLLIERPNAAVDRAISIQYGSITILDMRSEDWIIDNNDDTAVELKRQLQKIDGYPEFYGKLPTGEFLYYDGTNAFRYKIVVQQPVKGVNLDSLSLQGSWWDYVLGYDANGAVIKYPKMLRQNDIKAA